MAAAVAVARQQGLAPDHPAVLSVKGNLIVDLAPEPVAARVATLTASTRADPFRWLANEVAVARYVPGQALGRPGGDLPRAAGAAFERARMLEDAVWATAVA